MSHTVFAIIMLVVVLGWVTYYLFLAMRGVPDSYWEKTGKDPNLNPELARGMSTKRMAGGAQQMLTDPRTLRHLLFKILRMH